MKKIVLVGLLAAGCTIPTVPPQKASAAPVTMPDTTWAIVQKSCKHCHQWEPMPAGVDLRTRTSVQDHQLPLFASGVGLELAPFVSKLTPAHKDTLIKWVKSRGVQAPTYAVPTTFTYDMNEWIAKQTTEHPKGWFWSNEDNWIDGATANGGQTTHRWYVGSFQGKQALRLLQTHQTSADSFAASRNPSTYGIVGPQWYHGHYYDYTIEGDVYGTLNRWFSVFLEASVIKPPGRSNRNYVRLQFDRDAVSLRSIPSDEETWPWGGTAASPGADEVLVGNLNKSGIFLGNKWYHFVFTSERRTKAKGYVSADTLGTMYTALVTDPQTKEVIANLWGIAVNDTTREGVWGFHKYSSAAAPVAWANVTVRAKVNGANFGGLTKPSVKPKNPPTVDPDGDIGIPNP